MVVSWSTIGATAGLGRAATGGVLVRSTIGATAGLGRAATGGLMVVSDGGVLVNGVVWNKSPSPLVYVTQRCRTKLGAA